MASNDQDPTWRDIFDTNTALPVHNDREKNEKKAPLLICVQIKSIEGLTSKDGSTGGQYSVRLSLYDAAFKQFVGRTWCGPPRKATVSGQKITLNYQQSVYAQLSVQDEHVLLVVEVVAIDNTGQEHSCGWGFHRAFKSSLPDLNTGSATTNKVGLFNGSPRALLFMQEPIEGTPALTAMGNGQALLSVSTHKKLAKVSELLPENVLVGCNDVVPGLAAGPRDPKTGMCDPFRKPRALKPHPCHIDNISLTLKPSIELFEDELVRQLGDDRHQTEDKNPEHPRPKVQIDKRYLKICVHNGWRYIGEPEVVLLQFEGGPNFKKTASFRKGHKRSGSSGSIVGVRELVHRNRVDLDGMLEDPALCVVFLLVYECSLETAKPSSKASFSYPTFSISIRWTAFNPFTEAHGEKQQVELSGGPGFNPDQLLVFQSSLSDVLGSSVELTPLSGGTLSFTLHHGLAVGKENLSHGQSSLHSMLSAAKSSGRPHSPMSDASGALHEIQPSTQSISHGRPPAAPSKDMDFPQGAYTATAPRPIQPARAPYSHSMPYPQRGSYVPVEIQHMAYNTASPRSSGYYGGGHEQLEELPFTPVHAPIMAVAPGMHSGQKLSRAAYARLHTAGFPQILDGRSEAPEVVDPEDVINFVPAKEEADRLQANEIYFQFLAFARCGDLEFTGGRQVSNVFFTFQFYRFPQITTERLLLGKPQVELASDPEAIPCVLQQLEKDGSRKKGPPGYQVKYHLDPSYLKPGEGCLFVQHLAQQTLHIDLWDGDSLHLIGSCAVELKHLCRQGREAVQVSYELDVVCAEYIEHETALTQAGDLTREARPLDVTTLLKGRLHLRMANVGHPADSKINRNSSGWAKATGTDAAPIPRQPRLIVNNEIGVSSFMGGSLNAINENTKAVASTKVCKAQHLAEINHELASVLFSDKHGARQKEAGAHLSTDAQRKLARMKAVRQANDTGSTVVGTFRAEKEERSRDLKTIELYREQSKKEGILNMLNAAITTEHSINPSLGTTEFFEFVLHNPYNVQHTVVVECDDPELVPITDPREWRHFKMLHEIYTTVEEGMFNLDTQSGKPEIFLRPKEKVHVPFKFLTLKADHTVKPNVPPNTGGQPEKTISVRKTTTAAQDPLQTRVARVNFHTREGKPIAILAVRIEPQPHVIDQTFRFHHPEQSFLKKSIRMPPVHSLPGIPVGGAGLSQVYVRCSDPNVICESKKVPTGEPHDIFLKVACGASPAVKRFFVAMYLDPYLSRPLQVWQFYIHAMQRVDVACVEGQTSRFTLILKGTHASRLVQCFSSHPLELQLHPTEPFMLTANSLHELHVGVRPQQVGTKFLYINVVDVEYHQLLRSWLVCVNSRVPVGTKFLYINVVDVEYHQLLRSWLVCVNSRVPVISKEFQLQLPLGGGKGSNKKINYTNPYPTKKLFYVRTNRQDLLQFKESRLEVAGGATTTIALRFAPQMAPGVIEILVFINDEDDKNEDTFCVKATYQ